MARVHTGAQYVEAITAKASDRRARSAFQALVLSVAKPRARLYDFGAGPGVDACFYAEHGFMVGAYDNDACMCDYFETRCREPIAAGHIRLDRGPYPGFLASHALNGGESADLLVSNFAPLNLIENLPELFAKFHTLLAPGGAVLASVLNPCFIGDLQYGWWWRNAVRLWTAGRYATAGVPCPVIRRRLVDFATHCAPHFALDRVYRGLPGAAGAAPRGIAFRDGGVPAWLYMASSRFMFLLFRRRGSPADV